MQNLTDAVMDYKNFKVRCVFFLHAMVLLLLLLY